MRLPAPIFILPVIAGLLAALVAGPAQAGTRVYLMRGLFDLSAGLDDLAVKLRKRGFKATVTSYKAKAKLAATAIRNYKNRSGRKVVIIGHSAGANAAIDMAKTLKAAKVPVALMVVFSPSYRRAVPRNVRRVINYYQSNSAYFNNPYRKGKGFRGSLRNVNLAKEKKLHHFNIEKNERLHNAVIAKVRRLGGASRPRRSRRGRKRRSARAAVRSARAAVRSARAAVRKLAARKVAATN